MAIYRENYKEKTYTARECIAGFQSIPGVGGTTIREIINIYGDADVAWQALQVNENIDSLQGISQKQKSAIKGYVVDSHIDELLVSLQQHGIEFVTYQEAIFPTCLSNIYNPPAVLFLKGNAQLLTMLEKSIAMVGARECSIYGRNVAHHFAKKLAENGVIIVSGGARGIDSFCHEGALYGKGATIAVMGCGLDQVYPPENKYLFDKIIENGGLLVSEFPPHVPPHGKNFPSRNRIISGLARAVVVVEAKASSGSLITADMAINAGRDVFAIPGNVLDHYAEGNHWLLRQGATVLTDPMDILEEYQWDISKLPLKSSGDNKSSMVSFTMEERKVLATLQTDIPMHIDDIVIKTELALSVVQSILLTLEMKHYIEKIDTRGYIISVLGSGVVVH